jgi:hypothetical protein
VENANMKTNRRNIKIIDQTSAGQHSAGANSGSQSPQYPFALSPQKMSEPAVHTEVTEPRPNAYRHWGINE